MTGAAVRRAPESVNSSSRNHSGCLLVHHHFSSVPARLLMLETVHAPIVHVLQLDH